MRVLVVHAHPLPDSYNAALHAQVLATLRQRGHEVDDCDLYREGFDPTLSAEDLRLYGEVPSNRRRVAAHVERLLAAEGLVFVYPVWNEGFPAILKGYMDRVFLPGVGFTRDAQGAPQPGLVQIDRLAAVCTYGAGRFATLLLGDPPRRVVKRLLRAMTGRRTACDYLALYGMDGATPERRAAFLARVGRAFARW